MTKTPLPTLGALQAFESAARHCSFTQAAIELNVTQGAISRQIRQLEQQLGTVLFQRIRQRVVLTDAGRRYRADVRQMLDQLEVATQRAMAYAGGGNVVTLAVPPTFSSHWLSPRLPRFIGAHPGITINCFVRLPRFDFAVEQFDAAIHFGPPAWPGTQVHHLLDADLFPMCSSSFRTAHAIGTPSDIARVPLLHQINRPRAWPDWFASERIAAPNMFRGPRFELIAMLAQAAVAGLGVALLPTCLTEPERAAGWLTVLPSRVAHRDSAFYYVVPESKCGATAVRAFTEWILEEGRAARVPSRGSTKRRA
jgi:LysR family glycine cleavage system transcriptional activator